MRTTLTVTIPENWTPEQARDAYEAFSDLAELVWDTYDRVLLDLYRPDLVHEDSPDRTIAHPSPDR